MREIYRSGGEQVHWTNKQENPTMCNLDRVLVSTDWEEMFPTTILTALTRVGSDHSPLLLDMGGSNQQKARQSFFEKQWYLEDKFEETVNSKWESVKIKWSVNAYSLDKL